MDMLWLTERIKLNYRKANLDKIKNTLSSTDWDRLLEDKIETAWNNFKNLILSFVDANVPKMKVSGTKTFKPIWLTNNKVPSVL